MLIVHLVNHHNKTCNIVQYLSIWRARYYLPTHPPAYLLPTYLSAYLPAYLPQLRVDVSALQHGVL